MPDRSDGRGGRGLRGGSDESEALRGAGRHVGEPRRLDDTRELQSQSQRSDHADAFMPDPEEGPAVIGDDLAETLAEDFIISATTGNNADDEALDEVVPEEIGGPFIETSAIEEYGTGYDAMNPEDGDVEPLPTAVSGLVEVPGYEDDDED